MKDKSGLESRDYWENLAKKSVSRFFLLSALFQRPMHGYEVAKTIERCCDGCCKPTDGMIYPALKELSRDGYVDCASVTVGGRERKVCRLTAKGEEAYRAAAGVWASVLPFLERSVRDAGVPVARTAPMMFDFKEVSPGGPSR